MVNDMIAVLTGLPEKVDARRGGDPYYNTRDLCDTLTCSSRWYLVYSKIEKQSMD